MLRFFVWDARSNTRETAPRVDGISMDDAVQRYAAIAYAQRWFESSITLHACFEGEKKEYFYDIRVRLEPKFNMRFLGTKE